MVRPILRGLEKIGFVLRKVLGQKRLDEGPFSFARVDNAGGKIREYLRITFVIWELRQEPIVVEE